MEDFRAFWLVIEFYIHELDFTWIKN